jgi:hypothetical protein
LVGAAVKQQKHGTSKIRIISSLFSFNNPSILRAKAQQWITSHGNIALHHSSRHIALHVKPLHKNKWIHTILFTLHPSIPVHSQTSTVPTRTTSQAATDTTDRHLSSDKVIQRIVTGKKPGLFVTYRPTAGNNTSVTQVKAQQHGSRKKQERRDSSERIGKSQRTEDGPNFKSGADVPLRDVDTGKSNQTLQFPRPIHSSKHDARRRTPFIHSSLIS